MIKNSGYLCDQGLLYEQQRDRTFLKWIAIGLGIVLASSVLTGWSDEPWAVNLVEIEVFLLVIGAAALLLGGKLHSQFKWVLIPSLFAACWPVVQNLMDISVYPFATWTAALTWGSYAGTLWIALHVFAAREIRENFRSACVVFGVAIAIQSMLQRYTFNGKLFWVIHANVTRSSMGPFINYDHYATFVGLLLPIALTNAWRQTRYAPIWMGAAAVLYSSAIAASSRAGAILVSVEALVLLGWTFFRGHRRAALRFSGLTLLLLLGTSLIFGWTRLITRFRDNDPFAGRKEIWPAALRMVRVHPWVGFGLGTWPSVYPAYGDWDAIVRVNHATSDWLEWASDGGLIFAGAIALIAIRSAWLCRQAPWGLGVVIAFVHCAGDYPFQKPTLMLWVMGLLGCLEANAESVQLEN